MTFTETFLNGCFTIDVNGFKDDRGLFARTYCKNEFKQIGFDKEFVQHNYSYNNYRGTIRGMHFQKNPFSETKLIRCIQGSAYDVAVDLRQDSPTYLQHFGIELSARNLKSILIPDGFAHGFQALEDETTLIYHSTQYYTPTADTGVRFDDPCLGIQWKLHVTAVSEKDRNHLLINEGFKGNSL